MPWRCFAGRTRIGACKGERAVTADTALRLARFLALAGVLDQHRHADLTKRNGKRRSNRTRCAAARCLNPRAGFFIIRPVTSIYMSRVLCLFDLLARASRSGGELPLGGPVSAFLEAHLSTRLSKSGIVLPIGFPMPVGGRPLPRFFLLSPIDGIFIFRYRKMSSRAGADTPARSNPSHGGPMAQADSVPSAIRASITAASRSDPQTNGR